MANSVYFNGNILTIPGAYSAIDTSGLSTKSNTDGLKTLALIGECTGGEPGTVQFFSDPVSARNTLKSGELLKACERAWNPVSATKEGMDIGGANVIACIRKSSKTFHPQRLRLSSRVKTGAKTPTTRLRFRTVVLKAPKNWLFMTNLMMFMRILIIWVNCSQLLTQAMSRMLILAFIWMVLEPSIL